MELTIAGKEIFPLNLGTNPFGWTATEPVAFDILDAYVERGGNFLDTADSYPSWYDGEGGASEKIIGDWFKKSGKREQIVLATKVAGKPSRKGLARANVQAAVEESLTRLGTNYIDLYYLHYDDPEVPVAEQVETFEKLVEAGKIRAIGLSNFTPERMREWFELADTKPVALQVQYSLLHRAEFEQSFLPLAREYNAATFSYFALASGMLTGKYRKAEDLDGVKRQDMTSGYVSAEAFHVVDELVAVAEEVGAAPTTVGLAWQLARGVTAPIASVSKVSQLDALMAAPKLELSEAQLDRLTQASAHFA
ncbi:aldo/keto reductase [Actinobaculum suis]|nr:aldo/keto reductase [Actinobaculum suis]KMY22927.1 alcohol dehydrogenase [Actinobaculum suis]OCA94756.1 alcohol dehydrogenase [Actinobaculum suis]OCA95514.1 alcohol dehydrogenase [Actinobaculum suis]